MQTRRFVLLRISIIVTLLGLGVSPAQAQDPEGIAEISGPIAGVPLFGEIVITGSANHPQFARYSIEFAFDPNVTDTWFPILTSEQPVVGSTLAVWDTGRITPGQYMLRLRMFTRDAGNQPLDTIVTGILVDVPPDQSAEPTAVAPVAVPTSPVELPPTSTPAPTHTPNPLPTIDLPPGGEAGGGAADGAPPFEFDSEPFVASFFLGVGATVVLFILLLLYTVLRNRLRGPFRKWLRRTISDLRRP